MKKNNSSEQKNTEEATAALLKLAKGFSVTLKEKVEEKKYDANRNLLGITEKTKTFKKHYAPHEPAIRFFLQNKDPNNWIKETKKVDDELKTLNDEFDKDFLLA